MSRENAENYLEKAFFAGISPKKRFPRNSGIKIGF
jgi:hypothetical protein